MGETPEAKRATAAGREASIRAHAQHRDPSLCAREPRKSVGCAGAQWMPKLLRHDLHVLERRITAENIE